VSRDPARAYLVDTNVPSELTRERPDARVEAFLRGTEKEGLFLSAMTIGEMCKGIAILPIGHRRSQLELWLEKDLRTWFAGRILPVTEAIAERWGQLAATARQQGLGLSVVDGLIAATALHHHLILVTRNTKDFSGLGIPLINPWES
jgi:predicted nucleic acid-binding protein